MFQGIFKSAINDVNKNYIFGTGSIPIQIKTAQLATFADGTTKQQGYQVAEVNKLISTMLTGWDADGNKPKSMSDNYLELILSCDNGFVVKKRLQFPHIIAWQNDNTPYNIADVYKEFSVDNWLKADDFENPDITLVVEPTDEILTTSMANPPEATTEQSGRFYLYYRNLPVGVNRVHIEFHIKTQTEQIDFNLEVIDGLSWEDAQVILASNEQAKINVLLGGVKDVYNFTGAEGDFDEITMHEWSALYQQIINLKPNNKFTHDLYFYVYDESEINTKITDLESKYIVLSGMGVSGIAGGVDKKGDTFYNSNTGVLRRLVSTNPDEGPYETVSFQENAIYVFRNTGEIFSYTASKGFYALPQKQIIDSIFAYNATFTSNSLSFNNVILRTINGVGESFYESTDGLNPITKKYDFTDNTFVLLDRTNVSSPFRSVSLSSEIKDGEIILLYYRADVKKVVGGMLYPQYIEATKSLTTHSYSLEMQGSSIDVSLGYPIIVISNNVSNFFNKVHTPNFIRFNASDKIDFIDVDSSESVSLRCYDSNFDFLGTFDISSVHLRTEFIKIVIEKDSAYLNKRILNIELTLNHPFEIVKNVQYKNVDANFFSYEAFSPSVPYTEDAINSYNGPENRRFYDNGYICLPPNYDAKGKPVPLVLFMHGTNGYKWTDMDMGRYAEFIKFIAANGYAVADCCGLTNQYGLNPKSDLSNINCKISPVSVSCVTNLYKYLMHNYNLCDDGCYIYGKSSGGLMTMWFALNKALPIKAAGGLAPSLDLIGSDMRFGCSSKEQVKWWLSLFGIDASSNIGSGDGILSASEMQFLLSKKNLLLGYDTMQINSNMDYDKYLTLSAESSIETTQHGIPRPVFGKEIKDLASSAKRWANAPIKIWHSKDDNAVLYDTSEWFIRSLRNAGAMAELRTMPNGTGKHHSVDDDPAAIKVNYQTTYSGIQSINVAYAELVDWFKRWGDA